MLMIVGEYLQVFSSSESSIEGLAFDVSLEIAKNGVPVSFESLISDDCAGLNTLEKLINADVLFDPALCNSDLSTATYNLELDKIDFDRSCSAMLSKEQFEETLEINEDVKLIHFGSISFYSEVTGSSIINTLTDLNPKPIAFFNPSLSQKQISNVENFKDKSELGLSVCDIAQIDDYFLEEMYPNSDVKIDMIRTDYPDVNFLYVKRNAIFYLSCLNSDVEIKISKTLNKKDVKKDFEKINSIITGAFLSSLHEDEVFGNELSNPIFVATYQKIDKALDFVIENLL